MHTSAGSPFVHVFDDAGDCFVLDLHTNRLFVMEPGEADAFKRWQDGESLEQLAATRPEVVATLREHRDSGLFCTERPQALAYGIDWAQLSEQILHERERTILEITQTCNLACRYCTFGPGFVDHRGLTSTTMSDEVARAAIDDAFRCGDRLEEISIGFYGGEPLAAFESMRRAIDYARRRAGDPGVRFSVTTNGTLVNEPIAAFLRDHEVSVLVSLDGPRQLHDRYRVFRNGRGSYRRTLTGLRLLLDTYGKALQHKIALSMVVPSAPWITAVQQLWDDEPWLPRDLRAYVSPVSPPHGYVPPPEPALPAIREEWLADLEHQRPSRTTLPESVIDKTLAQFHQRPQFPGRRRTFFPNGCCVPGKRKVYVRADGTYQVCERVHGVPTIGSVHGGIDLDSIRALVDEYCERSIDDCRQCPASTICGVCFVHAFKDHRFDLDHKRRRCREMRRARQSLLKTYVGIARNYPHKLDEWEQAEIQ